MLMRRALPRRHRRAAVAAACLSFLWLPVSGLAGQAPPPAPGSERAAAPGPGTPTAPTPGQLAIEHEAPRCLAAGQHARLTACFRPAAALARARLYFRAGGTQEWFYVEMSGNPPCLEGALPRPRKGTRRVEYYVAATDRSSAETRTPVRVLQVTENGTCPAGPIAPVANAASPVIGSASGAAPAGFVTGGGGLSPLLIAGGVAVIGGGAAAVVVGGGGGGGENPPTTTLPPAPTTTTTTTATTTTTTTTQPPGPTPTTTTTTLPPCETPMQPPIATITWPTDPGVGGLQVEIRADAQDPAPGSGVKEVRFYWAYCPGGYCGTLNSLGADTTAPYSAVWVFPTCSQAPEDRFLIVVRAEDNCGNVSADARKDVRLTGRPCFLGDVQSHAAGTWVSELSVPGGRGQVVVDGTDAVFPAGGLETFSTPTGPGAHRFEATLVDGTGRPGTWRFDLSTLRPVAGSLRVVAGEAALTGPAALVFRLRGRPGERVVFSFDASGTR